MARPRSRPPDEANPNGPLAQPAGGLATRTPPHNLDAEQGVLACVLHGGTDTFAEVASSAIVPESFYHPGHRLLYEAMLELFQKSQPIDELHVVDRLQTRGQLESVGGTGYLNVMTARFATPLHVAHYVAIVREKYLLRRLIAVCATTVERCFEQQAEGVHNFLDSVEQDIFRIAEERTDETRSIKDTVKETTKIIHMLLEKKGQTNGVPSGFTDLDRMTFGFQPGDMIVLAARPSMGKTSLALNFVEHAVLPRKPGDTPKKSLIFSLEMTAESLALRLLCSRAGVDLSQLKQGTARKDDTARRLMEVGDQFLNAPLKINDSSAVGIGDIRAIARRIAHREGLDFIVIDYLQLIKGNTRIESREQQISEISRGVKGLAKELNVPVVVLSQLNRESEKNNRTPRLSDLRESGAIEQDADLVMMIAPAKDATEESRREDVVKVELIVAKQRNGPTGSVPLVFQRNLTRFENYTQS
jgi:replicative DNA helicase